jgi:hypothetical protein
MQIYRERGFDWPPQIPEEMARVLHGFTDREIMSTYVLHVSFKKEDACKYEFIDVHPSLARLFGKVGSDNKLFSFRDSCRGLSRHRGLETEGQIC